MVERNAGQRPDRFKGRKPVQVVFAPQEYEMVKRVSYSKGISVPDAIRRAIHIQEWLTRLQKQGTNNLVLGIRNERGEIETTIPVKLLPPF